MKSNVKLEYTDFPKKIEKANISISDDKSLSLHASCCSPAHVVIDVKDETFGMDYDSSFEMDFKTAVDFYRVFRQLLKQAKYEGANYADF